MRFRLRTLLIVLALGPMVLAGAWFAWPWVEPFIRVLWEPQGIKGLS
jgi:hypothetical protein